MSVKLGKFISHVRGKCKYISYLLGSTGSQNDIILNLVLDEQETTPSLIVSYFFTVCQLSLHVGIDKPK